MAVASDRRSFVCDHPFQSAYLVALNGLPIRCAAYHRVGDP